MDMTITGIVCAALLTAVGLYSVLKNGAKDLGPYTIGLAVIFFSAGLYVILFLLSKVEFGIGQLFTTLIGFGAGLITTKMQNNKPKP